MLSVARLRAESCACPSQVVRVNANILSWQICPWRTTFAFPFSKGFTANTSIWPLNILPLILGQLQRLKIWDISYTLKMGTWNRLNNLRTWTKVWNLKGKSVEEHMKESPESVFQELWSYVSHGIKLACFAHTWESLARCHLKTKKEVKCC